MTDQQMQVLMFTDIRKHELRSIPIPQLEKPDDVILKVKTVGVCGSDLHGYTGQSGRRKPPMIMGHEATADVIALGSGVENLEIGDRVAIQPVQFCGYCSQCMAGNQNICENRSIMGVTAPGAYAEYVKWSGSSLYKLPETMDYEIGALAEPLCIALHAVGLAHIKPYDTAYIVGAGTIGLLTLAVLRLTGVNCIIVSDTSDERLRVARDIGADVTLNPKTQNPREVVNQYTQGRGVDISFEAVGLSITAQQTLEVTRNQGQVIWIGNNQKMIEIYMQAIETRE